VIDETAFDELIALISDRFTPDELCEILSLNTKDILEQFREECLQVDWSEHL